MVGNASPVRDSLGLNDWDEGELFIRDVGAVRASPGATDDCDIFIIDAAEFSLVSPSPTRLLCAANLCSEVEVTLPCRDAAG